ncbi:SRPBCC family protein [Streptomyces sp. NBC_00091]|uniref:SRPBCC family protein n=1 Tax=Streptomyces sp. NBC_00091 TaxID=2975648 RepID=UPI00224FDACE|nr:SRPBCC family protein [Streptomyces sp. NBC_00091]MCX5381222.1 SRPBCC family protein [Streptomyces sp. NBC_00091]
MSVERVHRMSYAVDAAAPAGALYTLVADATQWPLFVADTVHVERLDFDGAADRYARWADVDGELRRSLVRRTLDAGRRSVAFSEERPGAPVTAAGGSWSVEELAPGWSRLTLEREIVLGGRSPEAERVIASVEKGDRAALAGLRTAAERWRRLDGLLMSFEESVRIEGPAEPVYAFLYEVGSWPGQVAHVVDAEVTEDRPGVQRTRLVSLADDGSEYTTRAVRVCFPAAGRIVFKRTRPHPLLAAHAGEWSVEPDASGVTVVCRHEALLDEPAVERILGPDADLARARRYVREVLGRESRATLAPATRDAGDPVRTLRSV